MREDQVADGARVPSTATVGGGYAVFVRLTGDSRVAGTSTMTGEDSGQHSFGDDTLAPEAGTLGPLHRQGSLGPLADEASLKLGG